ncbi:MAG: hypothetical protein KGL39_55980 [Patescibacteria group bacterium]|nr:hypothetical protein [Patescibacteria group bacterium]
MKTREPENFGKIADVNLAEIPNVAECDPGMDPVEYNVIIAPAREPETVGKNNLIIAPDITREQLGLARQVGRLVRASPLAFNFDEWPRGARRPLAGDIVWYARYAGGVFTGADGREYRILKDRDIGAIIQRRDENASS